MERDYWRGNELGSHNEFVVSLSQTSRDRDGDGADASSNQTSGFQADVTLMMSEIPDRSGVFTTDQVLASTTDTNESELPPGLWSPTEFTNQIAEARHIVETTTRFVDDLGGVPLLNMGGMPPQVPSEIHHDYRLGHPAHVIQHPSLTALQTQSGFCTIASSISGLSRSASQLGQSTTGSSLSQAPSSASAGTSPSRAASGPLRGSSSRSRAHTSTGPYPAQSEERSSQRRQKSLISSGSRISTKQATDNASVARASALAKVIVASPSTAPPGFAMTGVVRPVLREETVQMFPPMTHYSHVVSNAERVSIYDYKIDSEPQQIFSDADAAAANLRLKAEQPVVFYLLNTCQAAAAHHLVHVDLHPPSGTIEQRVFWLFFDACLHHKQHIPLVVWEREKLTLRGLILYFEAKLVSWFGNVAMSIVTKRYVPALPFPAINPQTSTTYTDEEKEKFNLDVDPMPLHVQTKEPYTQAYILEYRRGLGQAWLEDERFLHRVPPGTPVDRTTRFRHVAIQEMLYVMWKRVNLAYNPYGTSPGSMSAAITLIRQALFTVVFGKADTWAGRVLFYHRALASVLFMLNHNSHDGYFFIRYMFHMAAKTGQLRTSQILQQNLKLFNLHLADDA